ncbi:xylose isomerase-like protein [Aspergillus pseudonomiae]|uniref:Xylose isomerase-like protein n=1 Tax=Aspergillus pseudonomiae TaxID=1506151 RepID=A0A5N7DLP7_9EURO|nr:xylose isomerase-like protein [Aspergillus pseudonomiae]KAE8407039.1 xylose isomerase-like protein [Aspergillus pseudonomiae]
MPIDWPPASIANEFGIATLSLGNWRQHKLQPRLEEAAKAGYKWIDLFDECWAAYLEEHGLPGDQLWEPTEENLRVARKLGDRVKSLGMRIACTQPLRKIEGIKDPVERRASLDLVAKRFPFMRAFDTDLVFMCASIRTDDGVTSDLKTVARDLAELGDMAQAFAEADGGPMLRIGYEGLSWATRNTWASTWEAVRMANRPNVGLIIDAFNVLAVEYADPYNPAGHGRLYSTPEESVDVLCASMAGLVASVPGDRIFFFQVGDAERMDPKIFQPPTDPDVPALLPWSRGHRLFPYESQRGGYMPVDLVAAAVVATGYKGPMSLEVFNNSLNQLDAGVPSAHARRGFTGLRKLADAIPRVPAFWEMWQQGQHKLAGSVLSPRAQRL